MNIKAILFDKDGTLIDFEKTYGPSTTSVIKHLSNGDADLMARMADAVDFHIEDDSFEKSSVVIAGSGYDIATIWSKLLSVEDTPALAKKIDQLYAQFSAKHALAFDFTSKALTDLQKANIPLGIATNDSEAGAKLHMEKLGLTKHFEAIIGADSGYGAKPKPGMILAFAEQLNIAPSEIAMVGDSTHDLITAKNAGAIGIGVATGLASKESLTPHADIALDSIADLPSFIDNQSN